MVRMKTVRDGDTHTHTHTHTHRERERERERGREQVRAVEAGDGNEIDFSISNSLIDRCELRVVQVSVIDVRHV